MSFFRSFIMDESGATLIEYGLVAALVSVAAIIALQLLGVELSNLKHQLETLEEEGLIQHVQEA